MFCDGCGAALQTGQEFCGQCGKQVKQGVHLAYPRGNRVQEHLRLLGIFWIALSALNTLQAGVAYVLANTIFLRPPDAGGGPPPFLHPLMIFLSGLLLVKAIVGFAVGWGLLQREPWARVVAMFLAFLALFFDIPFGAVLGIYTLWVLLPAKSEEDYEAQVRSFNARRSQS
jgi:hypothetical protein